MSNYGPSLNLQALQEIMMGSQGMSAAPTLSPTSGLRDALIQGGLATMAASAAPGATLGSSVGQGMLSAGVPAYQRGQQKAAVEDYLAGAPESFKKLMAINPGLAMQLAPPPPEPKYMTTPDGVVEVMPDGRTRLAYENEPEPESGPAPSDVGAARSQFNALIKPHQTRAESYAIIEEVATSEPSAAGDLSLIFSYMKVLDPASSVREGEQATAQNATGVDDQVRNLYNRVRTGQRLSDTQRADFLARARQMTASQVPLAREQINRYTEIANWLGVDPSQVVTDPYKTFGLGPFSDLIPGN